MKTVLTMILLSFGGQAALGQDQYLWVKMSSSRVIINAVFSNVNDDSLSLSRGAKRFSVSLYDVVQIRVVNESSLIEGAATGALIGSGVGAIIGYASKADESTRQFPETSVAIYAVVGAVVGTVQSAFDKPSTIVDLSGRSNHEKASIIHQMFSADN